MNTPGDALDAALDRLIETAALFWSDPIRGRNDLQAARAAVRARVDKLEAVLELARIAVMRSHKEPVWRRIDRLGEAVRDLDWSAIRRLVLSPGTTASPRTRGRR